MAVNPDFRDLFATLNGAGAEYLVIGAHALAVHGAPRFTKDLDLLVGCDEANAQRVWRALEQFGAPLGSLRPVDLGTPGLMFQMGIAPNRIDILTSADGLEFESAWNNKIESRYGDQPIWILGRQDLLTNKAATGRAQDLADIEALNRMEEK
ncbi:MAG: hypothetical protein KGN80_03565 [Acidobacteriota bacterium]|nr:hypothetical protein [Acidobacteriota bacterium]